jgi:hypothetical protein
MLAVDFMLSGRAKYFSLRRDVDRVMKEKPGGPCKTHFGRKTGVR